MQTRASEVAQWERVCLPVRETWVRFLCLEDPLEKWNTTHSSIPVWKIP